MYKRDKGNAKYNFHSMFLYFFFIPLRIAFAAFLAGCQSFPKAFESALNNAIHTSYEYENSEEKKHET